MIRTATRLAALASVMTLCVFVPGTAQERQRPFGTLIAQGFKIVAAIFIPAATNLKVPVVVITMQLGKQVAVCTVAPKSWEEMDEKLRTDASVCDIRSY